MHSVQGGYMDKALSYSEKAVQFMSDKDPSKDRGKAQLQLEGDSKCKKGREL